MDPARFDEALRSLTTGASRRVILAGLASSLIATFTGLPGSDSAEAKKRKGKRKKKK